MHRLSAAINHLVSQLQVFVACPRVSHKIALDTEAMAANRTHKGLHARVLADMVLHVIT